MGEDTKIEWAHHTFNTWLGCTKVSEACTNCYAESMAKRTGRKVWGAKAPRQFLSDKYWREPLKWNAKVESQNERNRVFCASMADVFEARKDLDPWRDKLWQLITDTPNLAWLLLTKRPHRIKKYTPSNGWQDNVWLGTTVEEQLWVKPRISELVSIDSAVRFLSCEPLLGRLKLKKYLDSIDWVIVGGESGHGARPMHPEWVNDIRDQCDEHGVPFFFKQWGNWTPYPNPEAPNARTMRIKDDLTGRVVDMYYMDKHLAGRTLDGRTWDEFPR